MLKNAWPQMRNFFGHKLGASVGRFTGTINPIRAHKIGQFNAAKNTQGIGKSGMDYNWVDNFRQMSQSGYGMKNYFSGQFYRAGAPGGLGSIVGDTRAPAIQRTAAIRMGVAGGIGAWGATNFLFGDNPVSNAVSFAGRAGVHTGVSAALGSKLHPAAGAGYAAMAVMNMARPGNNWGPF